MSFNALLALQNRYPNRRAAITGAGSGVGRALALHLSGSGWTLFLNDSDAHALAAITCDCVALGAQVYSECFDVSRMEHFHQPVERFLLAKTGVDLVFACAGIGLGGPFTTACAADLTEVVNVNLLGTMWTAKAFLPTMIDAGKGHFIAVASAAAYHGLPHLAGYAATKAGVVQFAETIRSELAPAGVDVTVKMTTFYTSNIAEFTRGPEAEKEKARSLVEMAPWDSAAVADALLTCVAKRQFYMVAPRQARFLWRFKRAFPEPYLRLVTKLFPKLEAKLLTRARDRAQPSRAQPSHE
jgi:NADP-dependent 3-hydroxy acid dehydrogenase YdfG